MEEEQSLFLPLLSTTSSSSSSFSSSSIVSITATTTSPCYEADQETPHDCDVFLPGFGIILRLLVIIFVGAVAVWANHEASKGFDITIVIDAKDSPAGRYFDLFYIATDAITRVLLNAISFVENILYPPHSTSQSKKQVRHVTLRLAGKNLTDTVAVDKSRRNEFVVNLSPSIVGEADISTSVKHAMLRAMARVWLWDGESRAPPRLLLECMVECICGMAGFGTVDDDDQRWRSGRFFLEGMEDIQRLNVALRKEWGSGDNRRYRNVHFT
ncbi:hypothetical protein SLEP1_g26317 [Rubroshorea leprosula]|uniref:Uncharacterized protein n=1 Tax=Rubroshorea leprosula TaxID=152421 RepID=A0AAV5JVZ6_9ROSI|nr:hypothetical protein SLEP1_g26317 [Rubroshorea leprosula]